MSVGSDAAAEILREAIARGADGGALVTGAEFEGGDSYATSRALSTALKKLHAEKPVSLVIFGKNTSDAGAGVVGTQTAAWLDWASVSAVKKIDAIDEKTVTVLRMMEDGVDTVRLTLPACISTVKEINEPRLPSLKGKMASRKPCSRSGPRPTWASRRPKSAPPAPARSWSKPPCPPRPPRRP